MTNRATHLCECNDVVDLLKHPMVMCVFYHAKFERSALNGVGINTGEHRNMGSAATPLIWNGRRG